MKKILEILCVIMLGCAGLISLLFFINNSESIIQNPISLVVFFVLIAIAVLFILNKKPRLNPSSSVTKLYNSKYFTLIAIVVSITIGLLVRLYFFTHFSYAPISDPSTFYEAARKIAEGRGMIGDTYAAFFPYLAAYNGLLGLATHLISDPWLAVILLNFILDIITGILIFAVLRLILGRRSFIPILGSVAWILSPFTILFSLVSIPIAAVNLFITLAIYLCLLVIKLVENKHLTAFLTSSLLLGIVLGAGNAFRPLFIIFIIALGLSFLYTSLTAKSRSKTALFLLPGFTLILVTYLVLQQVGIFVVQQATNLEPASNSSGWSIFVGTNRNSSGKWNIEDEGRMAQMCQNLSRDDCHGKLKDAGLARLNSYGVFGTLELAVQKLYIFSSDQDNIYNADASIQGYKNSNIWRLFNIYIPVYFMLVVSFVLIFFYKTLRQKSGRRDKSSGLFLSLLIIGIFFSAVLVETSPRYAQVMYPIFVILAALGVSLSTRSK